MREPLLAGGSWGAALYQVVEFPISRRMVGSPGGNPGACGRGTAVPETCSRVRGGRRASEGECGSRAEGCAGCERGAAGVVVCTAEGEGAACASLACATPPPGRRSQVWGLAGQGGLDLVQRVEPGSLGSSAGRWRAGSPE